MHTDYTNKGVDQLMNIISTLKTNPNDRRMILCSWNPPDLPIQALPPCHVLCQFYVSNGELSCQMYQRSCDMGLGVPFNIASYALLTKILAHVCGLKCGDFIHTLGDAHVYKNHISALNIQLLRKPRPFPKLLITTSNTDIEKFKIDDFKLVDYEPFDKINMEMSV
jgi:thymidylate synthase